MTTLTYQIIASVFGAVFIVRLGLAPYWMHKEDLARRLANEKELQKQIDEAKIAQEKMDQKDRITNCLADCLNSAMQIRKDAPTSVGNAATWNAEVDRWLNLSRNQIQEIGGVAMAVRFLVQSPSAIKYPLCHPDSHAFLLGLLTVIQNLKQMIDAQSK